MNGVTSVTNEACRRAEKLAKVNKAQARTNLLAIVKADPELPADRCVWTDLSGVAAAPPAT
jgi:hypothetical protein